MNCRSRGWFLGDLELNIRSKGNTGCHVATLRHHDFCTSIIKSKGRPNFEGIEESTDESTESRAAAIGIIGEDTSFCISSFVQTKQLMISRFIMCILKSSMF